jgi:MFS family permease
LKVRNYRLYWFGQLVSMTGTWMQTTAQALLVLRLTSSAFSVGLVSTLQFLPALFLSLFGGVIADRVNRHRLLFFTQSASLMIAAVYGVLVATNAIALWQIYVLAFLGGLINATDQPVRQSFAATLVPQNLRANAVALNSVLFNSSRILGPALAGVLIGFLGIAPIYFFNALSFVAVLVGLALMNQSTLRAPPAQSEGSVLERLKEGLTYVRRTPEVFLVMVLVAGIGTFGYNFSVTLPLIGGFLLKLTQNAAGYGLLGALMGVGSLLAALATAFGRTVSLRRLFIAALAFSVLLGAVAWSRDYVLSSILLFALGFAGVTFTTNAQTMIQTRVPDELRGRVTSLYFTLFMGSTPIGGLLTSILAHTLGVGWALGVCAALCVVCIALAGAYRSRVQSSFRSQTA